MAAKASGAETFPAPPSLRGELSVASVAPKHAAVWENSFITKPEGYGKTASFNRSEVAAIVQAKLLNRLEGVEYDAATAAQLANELSTSIKDAVKGSGLTRYKLVVHVSLGQRAGQALRVASRGLWDAATDNFVSEVFETETLLAAVQVYGIYYE